MRAGNGWILEPNPDPTGVTYRPGDLLVFNTARELGEAVANEARKIEQRQSNESHE